MQKDMNDVPGNKNIYRNKISRSQGRISFFFFFSSRVKYKRETQKAILMKRYLADHAMKDKQCECARIKKTTKEKGMRKQRMRKTERRLLIDTYDIMKLKFYVMNTG